MTTTRHPRRRTHCEHIAIIGAGPGLGLAIARTFGSKGYDVALVSRNQAKLDDLVARLHADGITAKGFPADVLDRPALGRAIHDAAAHFGGIDVLEYSPVGTAESTKLTHPTETTPGDVQHEIEFQLYGAIAATQAVLPAMHEAGAVSLLFTTGAGSVDPVPMVGNVNAAAAALRNWAVNLNKELADTNVYAAHVGIDISIDKPVIPGFPTAPAADIRRVHLQTLNRF